MGFPPIRSLVCTVRRICKGGGGGGGGGVEDRGLSLGQDIPFSPTALRGPSPFPPIWRIWPDAADFGIRRRRCDSPVSPFPQNFPTPSSPQLDRQICTGRLQDQRQPSLNEKVLSSFDNTARYIYSLFLAFTELERNIITLWKNASWHIWNCVIGKFWQACDTCYSNMKVSHWPKTWEFFQKYFHSMITSCLCFPDSISSS